MANDLPEGIRRLLWHVDADSVDVASHRRFLIRRILDLGDAAAVRWLRQTYADVQIKDVLQSGRGLHPKTLAFWQAHYHLPHGAAGA
jgi:hypothetical protein